MSIYGKECTNCLRRNWQLVDVNENHLAGIGPGPMRLTTEVDKREREPLAYLIRTTLLGRDF